MFDQSNEDGVEFVKLSKKTISIISIATAVVLLFTGVFVYFTFAGEFVETGADVTTDPLTSEQRFDSIVKTSQHFLPQYKTVVDLAMADGPGKPKSRDLKKDPVLSTAENDAAVKTVAKSGTDPLPAVTAEIDRSSLEKLTLDSLISGYINETEAKNAAALPTLRLNELLSTSLSSFKPNLRPSLPDNLLPDLLVTTPKSGDVLLTGAAAQVTWLYTAGRTATFNVYLSIDGGRTFEKLATGLTGTSHSFTVPAKSSAQCRIRVDAYVGTVLYVSDQSDTFSIAQPPQPEKKAVLPNIPDTTPDPLVPSESLGYLKAGEFFINKDQDGTRWFNIALKTGSAAKLLWQVSKVPFSGLATDAVNPYGLLAFGELKPSDSEFSIDFNAVFSAVTKSGDQKNNEGFPFTIPDSAFLIGQSRQQFYIRVIALDAAGKLLGDAGDGITTGYGSPVIKPLESAAGLAQSMAMVQTWTSEDGMETDGLYGYKYLHQVDSGIYAHPNDKYWDFQFRSTPEKTVAAEIQVTTSPFSNASGSYENPAGLVYRNRWDKGTFTTNDWSFTLPLLNFTEPVEKLGTNTVRYYVRMVFFRTSDSEPGVVYPITSETQLIYYNNLELNKSAASLKFAPTQQVTVKSNIPYTTFQYYIPAQWDHPDAYKYFEVTRRILWNEMEMTLKTPDGTIYPYPEHYSKTKITQDEYQALLDKYLPVGSSFSLTVKTSWWDDFTGLLGDIYNAVRQAYSDLKDSAVDFVADNFPLIDGDTREALRSALSIAVSAGLTAIGLPPELPDFEALAANGFEYCLQEAIDEACRQYNIPQNEITDEIRDKITSEFKSKMEEIAKTNRANPLGVDYLKPAAKYRYRPAELCVFVQNMSDSVSPGGTMRIRYAVKNYILSFYETKDIPIPELLPGTHLEIHYYWKPTIGSPVADYWDNYKKYYYGNSTKECEFSMSVTYDLPDAETYAQMHGINPPKSAVPLTQYEYVYDHDPVYTFSYIQPPCEYKTGGDPNVDIMDFFE